MSLLDETTALAWCDDCGRPAEVCACSAEVGLPDPVEDWLAGLVYAPKRAYARAWAIHILEGGPAPEDPGTEWAGKARARFARVLKLATGSGPKPRDLTARQEHECTRCGAVIGVGDHYTRRDAPRGVEGAETVKACTDCAPMVR